MLASLRFHVDELPLVFIIGGVVFQLVNALIANRNARIRSSPWWLGMIAASIVFLVARLVHRATIDPEVAVVAIRVQYTVGISFAILATGGLEALLAYPRASKALVAMAAVATPLALVTLFTPWIVGGAHVVRADVLGFEFFAVGSSRVLVLAAFYVTCATPLIRRMRALPASTGAARRTFRIGSLLLIVTGVNDTLMSAGLITSLHTFEYAFMFISTTASSYVQRRADVIHRELEEAVNERTAELDMRRRDLEAALVDVRRGEERYRYLASSTSEAVLVLEAERVIDSNRAFHEMFRVTAANVSGSSLVEALGVVVATDREVVQRLLGTETNTSLEVKAHRGDGTEIEIEIRAPMPQAEAATGRRVVLVRDVSEQKAMQRKLLRADRLAAMGTLAAGTAHEINNPLTYVMSNAQVLQEELASPGVTPAKLQSMRDLAAEIAGGAERIRTIVKDLMALAKERPSGKDAVDVRHVVDSSLAIATGQLRHKAQIVRTYADTVPLVRGDEIRLGQVFLNLLLNAADALPDGHVADHQVTIEIEPAGEGMVVVRVRDTGSGMPPHVLDRIFDPFYTTKDVGRGTGLGLSVSLGITNELGGRIEVASTVGAGTTFSVFLPVAARTALPATSPPRSDTRAAKAGHVLVVDDEPLTARAMARQLVSLGVEVDIVHSGREALERCATTAYDAIVCDLMMHDVTGMEVHARLLETAPDVADRMVFVTGGVFTADGRAFVDRIGDRVLDKPVPAAELRAAVAKICAAQRATRAELTA